MRIAFNASALRAPLTGIGHYVDQLGRQLAAQARHEVEFFDGRHWSARLPDVAAQGAGGANPGATSGAWRAWVRRLIPGAYAARRMMQAHAFTRRATHAAFDLYHEPNFLPLPFDGPVVTTVHDLSWIRYPQAHPAERVRALNRYFEPGLRRSTLILTDSQFVREEVMSVFGVAAQRILAVPLGVSPLFRPQSAAATATLLAGQRLNHGHYLLAVGTLEPRKNLIAALRAYALLDEPTQQAYPLVLAGQKGWHTQALERELQPLLERGRVRLTGYLSRADLALLIAGATALVYPSIYEGFGLPPLEAMACAVPVITSNVASLPEVVGDAGLLVDPHDPARLRDAMRQLIDSPPLRARLGAAAQARAAQFTWEKCAQATVAAYERAVGAG